MTELFIYLLLHVLDSIKEYNTQIRGVTVIKVIFNDLIICP